MSFQELLLNGNSISNSINTIEFVRSILDFQMFPWSPIPTKIYMHSVLNLKTFPWLPTQRRFIYALYL